jgi:hypothetical protein
MKPNSSTLYLLHALKWLNRAIWWRKEVNEQHHMVSATHAMLVAGWARDNFQCWRRETFRA